MASGEPSGGNPVRRLLDKDLLSALVLFFIGGVALSQAGPEMMNWLFPRLAAYLILALGLALLVQVALAAAMNRAPDLIDGIRENRVVIVDLAVFGAIVLVYMLVMYGLGFWLASFLMLSLTSLYLTIEKTPRNVMLAIVVPLATCVVAYVIFLHVFYVPLPQARWWFGFR